MISIQQIKEICNNTKFKKIKLPISNIYTQPTYEKRKYQLFKEIENEYYKTNASSVSVMLNNEIISTKIIINDINSDSVNSLINDSNLASNVIENLENQFGNFQMSNNMNKLAPELLNKTSNLDLNIDYDNILNYGENEKIQLFGYILELFMNDGIFAENNIELNDCYFYGFKNPDSFIKSVMLLDNPAFIIKNKYDIHNDISSYKNEFSMHFEEIFTDNYYKLIPCFNKSYKVCRREFIRKENFNYDEIIQAYSDKTNSNMFIFNIDHNTSAISFKIFIPKIFKNNIHLDNNSLLNITWDKILLCYKSCYIPLIIPKTGNKLKPSLFTKCNNKFEFSNKSVFNYDIKNIKLLINEIDNEKEKMKNSANLNKTLNTPVLFTVQNNDKRLHQMRLNRKKNLHDYEKIMDFTEIDNLRQQEQDQDQEQQDQDQDQDLEQQEQDQDQDLEQQDQDLEQDPEQQEQDQDQDQEQDLEQQDLEQGEELEQQDLEQGEELEQQDLEQQDLEQDKIQLNKITSYKLQDLQNLMAKYGLTTQKQGANGKMKNKTKQECYNELKNM